MPGGRIELPTPAFSGLRSTTELPRHIWTSDKKVSHAFAKKSSTAKIYYNIQEAIKNVNDPVSKGIPAKRRLK